MKSIEELRKEIDKTDNDILELLAKRADIAKEIARCKQELNLSIVDAEREKEVKKLWKIKAQISGLPVARVFAILKEILETSREIQKRCQK
ncbi:MAG: chorismate mutase [Candidatus Methanofastidiosia archaeon]